MPRRRVDERENKIMPKLKPIERFDLIGEIRNYFNIKPYMGIIEWAQKNISFTDDVSAQRDTLDFETFPYQIDILKAFEDLVHIKKIVVCAPQQFRLKAMSRS